VHNPAAMRLVQRIRGLHPVLQHLLKRPRSFLQPLSKGFSLHALHHQVIDPILTPNVMQHADVRMIQARDGFGFALEALLANRIRRELRWQNLDCHGALEARVSRPIHFAHPACAKRRRDFVGAKMCAWRERHKLPRL
jgi:hypothetical protein